MVLESSVENWVDHLAKERGGKAYKLVGYNGIPDRLILLPGGVVAFAETKKPAGGVLSKVQGMVHKRLRGMGFKVFVPCTREQVRQTFEEI